jgi:hypothetical protein
MPPRAIPLSPRRDLGQGDGGATWPWVGRERFQIINRSLIAKRFCAGQGLLVAHGFDLYNVHDLGWRMPTDSAKKGRTAKHVA